MDVLRGPGRGPQTPATAATVTGPYEIVFAHSGKCLDVAGATPLNVQLTQYTCTGAYNTHWYLDWAADNSYFLIRNRATGLCANVSGNIYLNGRPIIQWTCNQAYNNERFKRTTAPNGYYLETWFPTDKVIHQEGNQTTANNAPVSLWGKSPTAKNTQVRLVQR
ncbi:RICIN domain-containing protein [Dactylosporangium sp. NPDC051541]|uniref:RICIN domain-containing protein n=1 Tax=Dactylosporangium sp. NPDC051541 TaxID=3363977 RepID=UPI003796B63C